MRIWIINGPNLNMIGIREPDIYGSVTYSRLMDMIARHCEDRDIRVKCFQSNHEGDLVDYIQNAYGEADGIVINPGAYTHTSIALLDALKAVGIPAVEVHISDPEQREPFRRVSFVRSACIVTIAGEGINGYLKGIDILQRHLEHVLRWEGE